MARWPPDKLFEVLIDWMWESPTELIPNNDQIREVLAVLEGREDAAEEGIQRLAAECREYLAV